MCSLTNLLRRCGLDASALSGRTVSRVLGCCAAGGWGVSSEGGSPRLDGYRTAAVAPSQIPPDSLLLFFMTPIVAIVQGKLLQSRELALDPIQP